MRQRPIIFTHDSVRAILAGRKTQTRRPVKGAHIITCDDRTGVTDTPCPYGVPGDRLWVRETWYHAFRRPPNSTGASAGVVYLADDGVNLNPGWSPHGNGKGWKPSIHMPRWASRITLEVVSVRAQVLQEIDISDALAEGMVPTWDGRDATGRRCPGEVDQFAEVWNTIHGKRCPWESNPWVWAVEFRVINTEPADLRVREMPQVPA